MTTSMVARSGEHPQHSAEFERGLRTLALVALEHERPLDPARRDLLVETAFPALRLAFRLVRREQAELF